MSSTTATETAPGPAPDLGVLEFTLSSRGTMILHKLNRFASLGKAGIVAGDEILAIGDHELPVPDLQELSREVCARVGVGGTVDVRLLREGEERTVPVRLLAKKSFVLDIEEVSEVLERKIAP